MTIGLSQFRDERVADRLHWMLALPFVGRPGDYPLGRREGGGPVGPDVSGATVPVAGKEPPEGATPGLRSQAHERAAARP
jgi:hypothetical protein